MVGGDGTNIMLNFYFILTGIYLVSLHIFSSSIVIIYN